MSPITSVWTHASTVLPSSKRLIAMASNATEVPVGSMPRNSPSWVPRKVTRLVVGAPEGDSARDSVALDDGVLPGHREVGERGPERLDLALELVRSVHPLVRRTVLDVVGRDYFVDEVQVAVPDLGVQ